MAKVHCCDQCGQLIKDSDIRITIDGFAVLQNRENNDMPKGFAVKQPEDFCSFDCLAEWALEQKRVLEKYREICGLDYGEVLKNACD